MRSLKLADNLSLPLAAVTEKIAFLGRTGSGKTYAAMKLAEEMLKADAQIVALDAVGKWYGLRVAGDGPGFEIPVFGGLFGDYPLEHTAGKLIADIIVDRGISAVLDTSQFTHGEQTRFALDFATHFFQRKKASPSAVHVFLEECQEYVPQNAMPGEQAMLSAFERLWKLGRNFGIGGSLISQRPQEINKKALNQTGTLVVFGMTGPQERKAIEQWVSAQGVDDDISQILPTLKPGYPHVWSPVFLGVSKTVHVAAKQTADISSTPQVGAGTKVRPLTPIDRARLATEMAATIERAKADDPKELKKQIATLTREVESARASYLIGTAPATPVLSESDRALLTQLQQWMDDMANELSSSLSKFEMSASTFIGHLQEAELVRDGARRKFEQVLERADFNGLIGALKAPGQPKPSRTAAVPMRASVLRTTVSSSDQHVSMPSGAYRRMLVALAQAGRPLTDGQLAARAGMALSGTFDKYLGQQRSAGQVEGPRDALAITPFGVSALGAYDPLPTGRDLQAYWLNYVSAGKQREMLQAALDAYPRTLTADELAHRAGMAVSGTFDKYLGQLRTLQLLAGPRSALIASDELFA